MRLGIRARSMILGMIVALAILAAAVSFILARHRSDPEDSRIRVTTERSDKVGPTNAAGD